MSQHSVAIVGAGAVGGFIGSMLLRANVDVCFVARGNYVELSNTGLALTCGSGRWHCPAVPVYPSIPALPPTDLVVVASKTPDIPAISLELARWQEVGTLVAFHNGLHPERRYKTLPSRWLVLGGVAYMSVERVGPAEVRVEGDYRVVIGPVAPDDPRSAQAADDAVRLLEGAGLNATLSDDLQRERLRKLIWTLVFAGPCTLLDVDTAQLALSPAVRPLLNSIYAEAKVIAAVGGLRLDDTELDRMIEEAGEEPGHLVSMVIDRRRGRVLELEDTYGAARELGATSGIPTPVLDTIYHLLAYAEPFGAQGR